MKIKFTRLISLMLIFVLAFTLVLSGCKGNNNDGEEETTQEGEKTSQSLALKLPYSKSDKLNPFSSGSMLNQSICTLLYDGLFVLDKNYNPKPLIAASYKTSGNKITVKLGSAKFSDGSKVTASDVVASFNSAKDSSAYKDLLSEFKEAKIKDSNIEFTLNNPDPYAVNCLTFGITKRGSKEDKAIGSGRYTLTKKEQTSYLKANSKRVGGFKPNIKEITLVDVPDVGVLKYTLAIGNISFAFDDLRVGDYTRFSASVKDVLMNNMVYAGFNKKSKDLKNEKVRQAISLLVDRKKVADNCFKGYATPAYTPFNPDWSVISGKDVTKEKDIDAAIKLLEEAGFRADLKAKPKKGEKPKDKLTISLLVNKDNGFKMMVATDIQEMLKKANITVNIKALKLKDYKKAVSGGDYDMYIGEIKLNESMNLSPMLSEKGSVSYGIDTKGKSSTAYSAFLSGSGDVFKFLEVFDTDVPFIPLCYRSGIAAYTRSLKHSGDAHINDIYADIESWKVVS